MRPLYKVQLTDVYWLYYGRPALRYVLSEKKEGNVSYAYAINTFYFTVIWRQIYGKDHSDIERGNPLPPIHELIFPISSKIFYICIM